MEQLNILNKLKAILTNTIFYISILVFTIGFNFTDSPPPPGWYQQSLPVNDFINDIFFIDTTTGWVLTQGKQSTNDTSYIFKTTNGGSNWITQFARTLEMNVIQFTDHNTGYAAGGSGSGTSKMFKTTNGGLYWQLIIDGLLTIRFDDLYFVNKDTGWVSCKDVVFGGLWKTTDGAGSWTEQLNQTYQPYRMSFINKDTGWVTISSLSNPFGLCRTTNGGINWNVIYNFNGTPLDLFFINNDTGWVNGVDTPGLFLTINGGLNWSSKAHPTAY
ncbi:MAG: hypothetical protein EHM58_17505, partial [Ignavibacteriae bacterium]